jgi:hypothetical protein
MAKVEPSRSETPRSGQSTSPPPKKVAGKPAGEVSWHPAWRGLVSVLIVLHIVAVFCAPWDLSVDRALPPGYVPPTDNLGRQIPPALDSNVWQEPIIPRTLRGRFFRNYLNLLYLNHGYEFFAPDPNGSHLIRYQIRDSGGQEIATGEFPDLDNQWPRLLYHRHMMLAAQTGDMGEASGRHYAQHLLAKYGGQTISTQLVFHRLLSPQEVLAGTPIDAPNTYQVLANIQETARPKPEQPIALPPTEGGR